MSTEHFPADRPGTAAPVERPTSFTTSLIWVCAIAWTVLHMLEMRSTFHQASISAPQQAAEAAMTAVYILAGYVVARGLDAMTR